MWKKIDGREGKERNDGGAISSMAEDILWREEEEGKGEIVRDPGPM